MKLIRLSITLIILLSSTVAFATSYTWNGGTSTAWGTSTNWTPNGIPGSGDNVTIVSTSNNPVYDGVAGVTNITVTSGTLDLNGYTLLYSGAGAFNGGMVTNGKIRATAGTGGTFAGTEMDCKVDVKASSILLNGSKFNDTLKVEKTGSATLNMTGGNKFYGYAEVISSGTNPISLANASPYNPDSAFADFKMVRNTHGLDVACQGTGHYFGGKLIIVNLTGGSVNIGSQGSVTYKKNIEIYNNTNTSVYFGNGAGGANHTMQQGYNIISTGPNGGAVYINRFTYLGRADLSLSSFSVFLNSNAVFEDTAYVTSAAMVLNGAWFKDTTSLKMMSGSAGTGAGGNRFDGPTSISVYSSELQSANSQPDTFNNSLWLNCLGGSITLARNCTGTKFNGDVMMKGKGGNLSLGNGSSSGATLADGYTLSIDTFNTGSLAFRGFVKAGDEETDLTLTGSAGTYFSHKTTFNGKFGIVTPSLYLNGGVFNDTTVIEKTGAGILNSCTGANTFNGVTTIIHDGATRMQTANPDTFNAPVTFIHDYYQLHLGYGAGICFNSDVTFKTTTSSDLYVSYNGTNTFNGNIYVASDASTGNIYFGSSAGTSTLASGKTIIEHADGFSAGLLSLSRFTKNGTTPMNLDFGTTGKVTFGASSSINGAVNYKGGSFFLNGTHFYNDVSLIKKGTSGDVSSGGNTFDGTLSVIDSASGNIVLGNSAVDDFNGNVSLTTASTGTIVGNNLANATYAGNLALNGSANITFGFYNPGSHTIFDGTGNQTISGNVATTTFKKLKVDKASGELILARNITVADTLKLVDGIIETDTFMVVMNDNSNVTSVNHNSYVDGMVKKKGNDAFVYPVGGNGYYRPIAISAPGSTGAEFVGGYSNKNSDAGYSHSTKDGSIGQISPNEYWSLNRTAGTDDVVVTLSWDTTNISCAFDSIDSLQVISWDGSQWKDLGNGGAAGGLANGTVLSNGVSTWYNVFTLATKDSFKCLRYNFGVNASTVDTLGEVVINIYGGLSPFTVQWDEVQYPNDNQIDSMLGANPLFSSLTLSGTQYSNVKGVLSGRARKDLETGTYSIQITDANGETETKDVDVSSQIYWRDTIGVTITGNDLVKTAPLGWSNAYMNTINGIDTLKNGKVEFRIDDTTSIYTIGLKSYTDTTSAGYNDLISGFYIEGSKARILENAIAVDSFAVIPGDILALWRIGGYFRYFKNGALVRDWNAMQQDRLKLKANIYGSGSKLSGIAVVGLVPHKEWGEIRFNSYAATITHVACSGDLGSIDLPFFNISHHTNIKWDYYDFNENTATELTGYSDPAHLTGLSPGLYILTALPNGSPLSIAQFYTVYYKTEWTGLAKAVIQPNDQSVMKANGGNILEELSHTWDAGAYSFNELEPNTYGVFEFQLNQQLDAYDLAIGLSSSTSDPASLYNVDPLDIDDRIYCMKIYFGPNITLRLVVAIESGNLEWIDIINSKIGVIYDQTQNKVRYSAYQGNIATSSYLSTPSFSASDKKRIDVSLSEYQSTVMNAVATFGCADLEFDKGHQCALLRKKIDGGYHLTEDGRLYFQYEEEYVAELEMKYKIYNMSRQVVASNDGTNSNQISDNLKQYGDNRFVLNLNNIAPDGMYVLEAESEKYEKFQLRFKKGY